MSPTGTTHPVEAFLEAPEFCALVMQAAPNGLAVVDANGQIVYANQAMARLFGYTTEELMEMHIDSLVPERVRQQHAEYRRAFMAAPVARPMGAGRDLYGLSKDGSEIPVEISLTPIRLNDQIYVLASVIDITVRKNAETAAQIHTHRMEMLNNQLATYTSAIFHDLRAPLRAIRNYADFLAQDIGAELPPKPREYLEALRTAIRQADRMVVDLVRLGRIATGDLPTDQIDFDDLFDEIRRNVAVGEYVEFITPSHWPRIEAPRTLLIHIFQNLIANAVKFNTSAPKRVEVGWRPVPDGAEFYVKDNGIGIDPRYHDRIFEPFERLPAAKNYKGTGIGLSLVKKAVAALDGDIRLESEPGRGSTFFVTIPQRRSTNDRK
ncbi:MAG TPA: PAS domain S-box protein [Anaerohalosphaeraceae bacterium]|jgi:PAS domain S-box-containing protein|nr:PAS domain S-box protein [Anaerohalosphaeraceae bacterium]HRT49758.1 PAS domain S-box protein [Anaerohalosphaeraceae bacterium]HRT85582.1 PAS domain S-box protein [Anaerohalosphaeraceae bacterium]